MKNVVFELPINESQSLIIPGTSWADNIFNLIDADRDHLREWLPWVDTVHNSSDTKKNLIERIKTYFDKTQAAFIGTYEEEVVASVGFVVLSNGVGEIGYWLLSQHQNKGLMTSYVRACLKYGFTELGLHRIVIKCAVDNKRSAAVAERLGFTLSSEKEPPQKTSQGLQDTLVYTLDIQEWK